MKGRVAEFLAEHRVDFEMWLQDNHEELELYTNGDLHDLFMVAYEEAVYNNVDIEDIRDNDHEMAIEFSEWKEEEGYHDLCAYEYGIEWEYSSRFDSVEDLVDEYIDQHLDVH